jgi:hypothetical protein
MVNQSSIEKLEAGISELIESASFAIHKPAKSKHERINDLDLQRLNHGSAQQKKDL